MLDEISILFLKCINHFPSNVLQRKKPFKMWCISSHLTLNLNLDLDLDLDLRSSSPVLPAYACMRREYCPNINLAQQ